MPKDAKKQVAARAVVDRTKKYTLEEACALVKKAHPVERLIGAMRFPSTRGEHSEVRLTMEVRQRRIR